MLQTKLYTGSDFPELLDETSGKFIKLPEKFSLEGFEPSQNPMVPMVHKDYVFTKSLFRESLRFWHVLTDTLFGLAGPTGSGQDFRYYGTCGPFELSCVLHYLQQQDGI